MTRFPELVKSGLLVLRYVRVLRAEDRTDLNVTLAGLPEVGFRRLVCRLIRIPNRRRDVAISLRRVVIVIDRDELAIRALDRPWVADVTSASVVAEDNLRIP